jgi:nucleotidyltransferase/DNA polymerase involved in DNA repair
VVHLACINLPLLPLQVLQRQEPALRDRAAAVVESGRAQARVLQVNAHAWRRGVRPGLRQAAALSLVGDLQTRTVPEAAVAEAVAQLTQALRTFSAHVEPAAGEPGLFWLSARGLRRLYGQPRDWCEAVHRALAGQGWQAAVVAGFGHFTTQAIARGTSILTSNAGASRERTALAPSPSSQGGRRGENNLPGPEGSSPLPAKRERVPPQGAGEGRREDGAGLAGAAVQVFTDPARERQAAARVPLERCGLTVDELEALTQLGLRRLGDLLRLPADGLLRRFGPRLYRLQRLATGTLQDPLQPQAERLPVRDWIFLEPPEDDSSRLLFYIKARLPFLLAPLAARREALHTLRLELTLDDHTRQTLEVRPAQPTRQERLILELVRLRLERLPLSSPTPILAPGPAPFPASVAGAFRKRPALAGQAAERPASGRRGAGKCLGCAAGIVEIMLEAEGRPREIEQPTLLGQTARRDLAAANRALAQLRAEFGEQAVVRAVPREGHLPEARFAWEPLQRLAPIPSPNPSPSPPTAGGRGGGNSLRREEGKKGEGPRPTLAAGASGKPPALVRRMLSRPLPLPGWPRDATRWTQGRSPDADGLLALHGPYVISGGWWQQEQERDYYLAETAQGEVQWLYHDRRRGRWFCQGWVE